MIRAYTYYLFHRPTGKKYYGVRYAPKAEPEQDLWKIYFSSSKKVKALVKEYGKDSFNAEIRKTFSTPKLAGIWEQKVIDRIHAVERDDWLNQARSLGPYYHQGPLSIEHKEKLKASHRGMTGKKHSEETKQKMRKPHKKHTITKKHPPHTDEHRRKNSESHKGQIPWNKGISESEDQRKQKSERQKGQIPWNTGKKRPQFSEEWRQNMSNAQKRRRQNEL